MFGLPVLEREPVANGQGGRLVPQADAGDTAKPFRLHYVPHEPDNVCAKCGFTLIDVYFIDDRVPNRVRPNATRDLALWEAHPFNCERVSAPAGKPVVRLVTSKCG